jgi:hypothetical protein
MVAAGFSGTGIAIALSYFYAARRQLLGGARATYDRDEVSPWRGVVYMIALGLIALVLIAALYWLLVFLAIFENGVT